jgi:signal transduction histidine kinase/DNA-binding LacI/PurR family transcriptional regulator/AraC-like DNA-binding protein
VPAEQSTSRKSASKTYPTIGYLGGPMMVEQPWQAGLLDAAREYGINLIIFSGGILESPNPVETQRSRIFELAGNETIDGLIIGSDFLGHYAGAEKIKRFCERYRPLPIVKYDPLVEGFPTLLFDFYHGTFNLISHLVEAHGLTRIAYITGPEQSRSIRDRFQAYQDALRAHAIPFDEKLVVAGSISETSGAEAVRVLFDERNLQPGSDVQAIVGFYDLIAANALQALQARGITVPDQIAVAGFDDDEISLATNPRLTTVRLPFYEIGRWGVETLASMLEGNSAPDVTTVAASLVLRHSCGCPRRRYRIVQKEQNGKTLELFCSPSELAQDRQRILAQLVAASGIQSIPSFRQNLERLLDLFLAEYDAAPSAGAAPAFADALQEILGAMRSIRYNVEMIDAVLAVLQEEFARADQDQGRRLKGERLFQQAHLVVREIIERFLIREKSQATYLDGQLHELNQELATTVAVHEMVDVLARYLPRLEIPACYLSLYEEAPHPSDFARLMLAYSQRGRSTLPHEGRRFAAKKLIPDDLFDLAQPASLVVLPLFHREEQMGFIVFGLGPTYGGLYEALREQISSVLKRIQLHRDVVAAQRLADEANRLKSRFLSTVAHELRTPLSTIVSLSEMLLEDTHAGESQDSDRYRQNLELIHTVGKHLDRLVLDVLELGSSQLGQLKIELKALDLGALLREVALLGEQMAGEKALKWRAMMPAVLPAIRGDRTRLRQVLLNLLNNAVKFTLHGEVALLVTVSDHEITVAVSDTGLGIPQSDQGTIFDEFRQSERTSARGYGGMGLGLAITRRLVELHGGQINLISSGEEGGGSTFYFTLPIPEDAGDAHTETEKAESSEQILVIAEDRAAGEKLIRRLLSNGFCVRQVQIDVGDDWQAHVLAEPCRAIILNCAPKAEWGLALLRRLRSHPIKRNLPVIFFDLDLTQDRGAFLDLDVASKPLGVESIVRALRQHGLDQNASLARAPVILVVDDEGETLRLHTHLLREHLPHVEVVEASDGRAALALMLHRPPDLVLLDLMMPELDGFGVLEAMQMHGTLRAVPVIIMTGHVLPEEMILRLDRRVAGILGKGLFSVDETLAQIEATLAGDKRPGKEPLRVARRTLAFLQANYGEPLTRGDVADRIGVNERYLTHCFREEFGVTPMAYLNRYRIKIARQLLDTQHKSITEIALEVGFSNSAQFSRVFRQQTGHSPREYLRSKV